MIITADSRNVSLTSALHSHDTKHNQQSIEIIQKQLVFKNVVEYRPPSFSSGAIESNSVQQLKFCLERRRLLIIFFFISFERSNVIVTCPSTAGQALSEGSAIDIRTTSRAQRYYSAHLLIILSFLSLMDISYGPTLNVT